MTIDIQAPPARVFAALFDVERWPEWTSTMTSVRRMDGGPLAVGSRAQVRQPRLRPAVWAVAEVGPGGSFTWVTRSPGVQATGRHSAEEYGAGNRVSLSILFTGFLAPLVARMYGGLTERYIATEAQGLKDRCEPG